MIHSWYATNELIQYIDDLGKSYYCHLKKNRLVDDTAGVENYKLIESLNWSKEEFKQGKITKIKTFPQNKKVKLSLEIVSTDKTEYYIASNNLTQDSTDAV